MRQLHDVAFEPLFPLVVAGDTDDLFEALVVDITTEKDLGVQAGDGEGAMQDQAIFVAVHQAVVIQPRRKWTVDEELHAVDRLAPAGHKVAGVGNQVRAGFERKSLALQPGLEKLRSPHPTDLDFLFPSVRRKGERPMSPASILAKSIRPALAKIGVVGKQIGWHSCRHSMATNLRSLGIDIKVAQELMRHSSCRTTLDVYTRAVDHQKREASLRLCILFCRRN
jgi:hypothetical protein